MKKSGKKTKPIERIIHAIQNQTLYHQLVKELEVKVTQEKGENNGRK